MVNVIMLSVIILRRMPLFCHNSTCATMLCHNDVFIMLNVVMQSAVMLIVVILGVVFLGADVVFITILRVTACWLELYFPLSLPFVSY
jgi:hypothetical protein